MEWQQIIGFYQLVKQKSFTGAANASFRTQSALSQQISKLEDEFQCQLINRINRKKFTLSPAGERFYEFASSVINEYGKLADDISAIKGLSIGKLKIAAPFTALYHLFPEQFKAYLKEYPHVEITILDRTQGQAIDLLKVGDIDLAVALESFVPKGFHVRRWKEIHSVLIVPGNHPLLSMKQVRLQDIAKYPLILPPKGINNSFRARIDDKFNKEGITYRVIMESGNVELSSRYVEAGIGISFATIAKGVDPLAGRQIKFIPMARYFEGDYVSVVCGEEERLPSHVKNFIAQVFGT